MKTKEAKTRENRRFSVRKNSKGIFCTQNPRDFVVSRKFAKFSRKSQAALEFLMTYGWAIMVVLVAIGSLAYFGVLSPDKFLPNKCSLPSGIACIDFEVRDIIGPGSGEVYVVIRNGIGYDISTVSIAASDCTAGTSVNLIRNGQRAYITANACTLASDKKYSGDINITYTNADTGLVHKISGKLTTRFATGFLE